MLRLITDDNHTMATVNTYVDRVKRTSNAVVLKIAKAKQEVNSAKICEIGEFGSNIREKLDECDKKYKNLLSSANDILAVIKTHKTKGSKLDEYDKLITSVIELNTELVSSKQHALTELRVLFKAMLKIHDVAHEDPFKTITSATSGISVNGVGNLGYKNLKELRTNARDKLPHIDQARKEIQGAFVCMALSKLFNEFHPAMLNKQTQELNKLREDPDEATLEQINWLFNLNDIASMSYITSEIDNQVTTQLNQHITKDYYDQLPEKCSIKMLLTEPSCITAAGYLVGGAFVSTSINIVKSKLEADSPAEIEEFIHGAIKCAWRNLIVDTTNGGICVHVPEIIYAHFTETLGVHDYNPGECNESDCHEAIAEAFNTAIEELL